MAVRLDAATDQLALADAPASSAPFTVCGWVRNIELIGFGTIMRLRAAGTVASFTASSGGSNGPQLGTTGGIAGPIVGGGDGSLPADAWRRVAFVIAGSGTDNCTVYWGDDDPATDLLSAVGTVAVGSPTALSIGGRGGGDTTERWGGDLAYPRAWDAVLTAAELKTELASTEAVVTDDLWADWPLEVHTDLTDHSGNGRHLAAGSTSTTTVDGPPLSTPITGSGSLSAPASVVSGTGAVIVSGAGAATVDAAVVAGDAVAVVSGSGTAVAPASTLSGVGGGVVAGQAAVAAAGAVVAGAGQAVITGSGGLVAPAAVVSGVGGDPVEPTETPASRTYLVPAGPRMFVVPAESRIVEA